MSDEQEVQSEEREVLASIYEGDERFKEINPTTFQYKYGEEESERSFLIEIRWGEKYPNELPLIEMELFYNKHLSNALKEKIAELITKEAKEFLGMSMTFSLFEFVKEHFEDLISEQVVTECGDIEKLVITESEQQETSKKVLKKENLSKAQKRRQWHKLDGKGEKPRGWNWVDLVKHLSQTGSKDHTTSSS